MKEPIKYIKNFFKEKDYTEVLNYIDTIGWNERGQDFPGSTYTTHYTGQIINKKKGEKNIKIPLVKKALNNIKLLLKQEYFPHNLYFNSYKFGDELQAHADKVTKTKNNKTLIIYCTKQWHKDWHGETLIYNEDDVIGGCLPMPNTAIIFDSVLLHSMAPISRYCRELRNILVFQLEGKENA